ncbi:MAG: flagellar hook-basal body complex protein FliE [Deferribacteraceae bacterium]|jgi:flagellar hook-basal body complex protein FliE|nr:flagellar hook-basal body complex protein FliE [Deferribacteraceae bacterium]
MADLSKLDALLPQSIGFDGKTLTSSAAGKPDDGNFSDILKSALNSVNNAQYEADQAVKRVLSGESDDIHDTMIALQKADVSLKMMLEVRNKILEAYQEVMRTQI